MYGTAGPMAIAMLVVGLASAVTAAATAIKLFCPRGRKSCQNARDTA